MFQRQLSTNALNSSSPNNVNSNNAAANNINGATGAPSSMSGGGGGARNSSSAGGPRLFQRQMTASQLFGGGGSASGGQSTLDSKQRAAALLASVRADPALANSAACLASSNYNNNAGQPSAGARQRALDGSGADQQVAGAGKKPAKNKRIISRMLSISAIHTTVASGSGSGSGGGGGSSSGTGTGAPSSACDQSPDDATQLNDSAGGAGGPTAATATSTAFDPATATAAAAAAMTGPPGKRNNEPAKDKFDSPFTRSRSSSTSSTTPLNESHLGASAASSAAESIQCIAFLEPLPSPPPASGGPAAALASGSATAGQTTLNASGGVQSSSGGGGAGSNHKSLCSIDNQAGQLALWLGTSAGCVLLVNLAMPDNEDNRVLQLQSINAEPIPQASVKLPGQILQIMPFTCEARPSSQSSAGAGHLLGNAASQSSSLEGDAIQSPGLSSGASISGATLGGSGGSLATSSGLGTSSQLSAIDHHHHHSSSGSSFDTRTALFLAVVSEKQARIYQVPCAGQQVSSTSAASDHHHHHHHQTHSSSAGADTPMAKLLTNKANLFAKCQLSDTSYACRSSHVQMRTPDESCLVSYLATGNLVVHALPRLRPVLMEADFVPYTCARIGRSMRFSRQGHCLYQPSVGEISKFTLSSQYKALVNEMTGALYVAREMPEMPRANFFKSLFSVSQSARQSDRDELFGDSGKPSRAVAKHVGGAGSGPASGAAAGSGQPGGLDKLKGAAVGTMGHDMRVAREGLDERGEKLGEIEDRTLNMLNSSESYAQAAHQLAQKFKDKKWYQF